MLSDLFYLIRSKTDGQYLVARPRMANDSPDQPNPGFLLLFKEYAEALSYLNTHATGVVEKFAVETLPSTQLKTLLKRWGFTGIGLVQDPLLPRIEFLKQDNEMPI